MMSQSGELEFTTLTHLDPLEPPSGVALADFHAALCLAWCQLRASCGTALEIPVITYMGKKGELIYVISLPGRISVAARGTKGELVEIGYATHQLETDDDQRPVRRLG